MQNDMTANVTTEITSVTEAPKKTFGTYEVIQLLSQIDEHIETIDDVASQALKEGDRKGVLLAMRVSTSLERTRKAVKRSLDRANRIRVKKGAAGEEVVELVDDDEDDE